MMFLVFILLLIIITMSLLLYYYLIITNYIYICTHITSVVDHFKDIFCTLFE